MSRFIKEYLIRRNEIKRQYCDYAASQLLSNMHEAWRDYVCVFAASVRRDKWQNGNSTQYYYLSEKHFVYGNSAKRCRRNTRCLSTFHPPLFDSSDPHYTNSQRDRFVCCIGFCSVFGCHRLMSIVHDQTFIQQVYYYCSSLHRCREQTKNRIIRFNSAYRKVTTLSLCTLNGSLHATILAMTKRHVNDEFVAPNWTKHCSVTSLCLCISKMLQLEIVHSNLGKKIAAKIGCQRELISMRRYYDYSILLSSYSLLWYGISFSVETVECTRKFHWCKFYWCMRRCVDGVEIERLRHLSSAVELNV